MPVLQDSGGGAIPDSALQQIINAAKANQTGATKQVDQPLVPLWKTRSEVPKEYKRVNYGGKRDGSGELLDSNLAPDPGRQDFNQAKYATANQAESSWFDLPDADKREFIDEANAAGLKINSGAEAATAWSKAVNMAAQYNTGKDHSKWVSPFEAMKKLGSLTDAQGGGYFKDTTTSKVDRSGTTTATHEDAKIYSAGEVKNALRQILQQSLGRDPSDAEVQSYMGNLNSASAANPQVTRQTTTTDTAGNVVNQASVTSGGIDPQEVLRNISDTTPEHKAYQAGGQYMNLVMQALGAVA